MSTHILLVEDDPSLGFVIQDNLTMKGYAVVLCRNGEAGQEAFEKSLFDLCILDVMMPRKDGFALAKAIRNKNKDVPILFVTAKDMLEDKLTGFKSGGDDYLVKPFSMEELVARIEVFLRRTKTASPPPVSFSVGAFTFDYANFTLQHEQGKQLLTPKEAEVLKLLCEHQGRILKREEILTRVWGDDDYFLGRSMDVFISKLRKYLKVDPNVQIINYHGIGFKLEAGLR